MSNNRSVQRVPRVIFFGMAGAFSTPSLGALLESGVEVCAVVVPMTPLPGSTPPAIQRKESSRLTRTPLPMLTQAAQQSIIDIALEKNIPLWEVQKLASRERVAILEAYQADI